MKLGLIDHIEGAPVFFQAIPNLGAALLDRWVQLYWIEVVLSILFLASETLKQSQGMFGWSLKADRKAESLASEGGENYQLNNSFV